MEFSGVLFSFSFVLFIDQNYTDYQFYALLDACLLTDD